MNEEISLLLSELSRNYDFHDLVVTHWDPVLVETDRGLKRIRLWEDERLLQKHLDWRQKLSGGSFFVDRMYVTVSGSPFIRFGRYAVTCHDAPLEPAPVRGFESIWSEVVETLLRQSLDEGGQPSERPAQERVASVLRRTEQAEILKRGGGEKLLRLCYPEAQERAVRCDELRFAHGRRGKVFMLPQDFTLYRSKMLLETLFVELGQSELVNGYPKLAAFFLESMQSEGDDSVNRLFLNMQRSLYSEQETSDLLQASWYEPGEWLTLAESALRGELDTEVIDKFKKTWDQKTRIISLFQSVYSGTG
jgi:hypothetical protein